MQEPTSDRFLNALQVALSSWDFDAPGQTRSDSLDGRTISIVKGSRVDLNSTTFSPNSTTWLVHNELLLMLVILFV